MPGSLVKALRMAGEQFDVFLSHNSSDKPAVEEIAHKLRDAGLRPWLDKWYLTPGQMFQRGLADALRNSATCAIFIGPKGIGDWAREELLLVQDRAAKEAEYSGARENRIRDEKIVRKDAITFENGNRAVVITASPDASAQAILDALEIASPRGVLLLFGATAGLDDTRKANLATLFADGVIPVATELGALIIDGGTQSGVMAMMGEAVAAIAANEALQSLRNGWRLLAVEDSGRLADELSAAVRDRRFAKSVELSEIARSGRVALFHVDDPAEKLREELRRMLCCCGRELRGEKGL